MKQDDLLEAMDHISPALVEQADRPSKRRLPRALRTALTAASICLALLGTAFAVEAIAGFREVEFFQNRPFISGPGGETQNFDGYSLLDGVEYYPAEELPQELLETAAANPGTSVQLRYLDQQRVKELIGLDITGNPTLDALIQTGFSAGLSSNSEGPAIISFVYSFRDRQNQCHVTVHGSLYTDLMEAPVENIVVGYLFAPGTDYFYEEYTGKNGLSAVISAYIYASRPAHRYHADFALDGMIYSVEVDYENAPDYDALALLKDILDDFDP